MLKIGRYKKNKKLGGNTFNPINIEKAKEEASKPAPFKKSGFSWNPFQRSKKPDPPLASSIEISSLDWLMEDSCGMVASGKGVEPELPISRMLLLASYASF